MVANRHTGTAPHKAVQARMNATHGAAGCGGDGRVLLGDGAAGGEERNVPALEAAVTGGRLGKELGSGVFGLIGEPQACLRRGRNVMRDKLCEAFQTA